MNQVTFRLVGRGVAEGQEVRMSVGAGSTVDELANLVRAKLGPNSPDFKLVCKGHVLAPGKLLSLYNLPVDQTEFKLVLVLTQKHWGMGSDSSSPVAVPSASSTAPSLSATSASSPAASSSPPGPSLTFLLAGRDVPEGIVLTLPKEGLTVDALLESVKAKLGGLGIRCLVCKGKVLKLGTPFVAEKMENPNERLKLVIVPSNVATSTESKVAEQPVDEKESKRERIRKAIAEIAQREGGLNYHLELQDQNGRRVLLPEKDRVALVQGMTLHEKGKAALAKKDYKDAVEWFTLADASFENCDPKFLATIDNVAYLSLDLVWTLFLTKELRHLQDARRWLAKAEAGFHQAHGPNRERLRAVKQGFCPENALYVRLRLLQAVVEFHSGNIGGARRALQTAQAELDPMMIRQDELLGLMEMGYAEKESRRALRAMGALDGGARDISQAVGYLLAKREEARQRAEKERKKRADEELQRRLGQTRNGQSVDLKLLSAFQTMGFSEALAAEALKHADNRKEAALMALTDPTQKSLLEGEINRRQAKQRRKEGPSWRSDPRHDEEALQLAAMGFDLLRAKFALHQTGNMETALFMLTEDAAGLDAAMRTADAPTPASNAEEDSEDEEKSEDVPLPPAEAGSTSEGSLEAVSPPGAAPSAAVPAAAALSPEEEALQVARAAEREERKKKEEERKRKRDEEREKRRLEDERQQKVDEEFLQDMVPDLETDPEAFLDIDLQLEADAIAEYTARVLGTSPSH